MIISLLLYAAACALPIFREDYTPGLVALLQGWMGILGGVSSVFVSWLANFTYFTAVLLPGHRKTAKIGFAILSLLLGLSFLAVKEIPIDEGGQNMDVSPGFAFYVWMASFLALIVPFLILNKKAGDQPGA